MTKIRSAYWGSTPMPLSVQRSAHSPSSRVGVEPDPRHALRAAELDGVADEVLEHGRQQRRRRRGRWAADPTSTTAPLSSIAAARLRPGAHDQVVAVDGLERAPAAADARELSRSLISCCIRLAPSTANSMYVGALVELPLVAPCEHLGEARHHAQRLLQVVRGDVGELLELGVRALQVGRLAGQRRLRLAQGGDLGDDAGPHAVDVAPELGHLARAGGVHLAGEVAARHAAHVRGQASERRG